MWKVAAFLECEEGRGHRYPEEAGCPTAVPAEFRRFSEPMLSPDIPVCSACLCLYAVAVAGGRSLCEMVLGTWRERTQEHPLRVMLMN